jgi:hypothetical protein
MKRKLTWGIGSVVAVAAIATAAWATVTFDPSTGIGFVGNGDVQSAFGWNSQALQANATGVSFTYNATDTYSATCTWVTGEGTRGEQTHNVDIPRHTSVNDTVAYGTRKNTQNDVTGFNLTGFGITSIDGTVPVVGDPCVGNPDGVNFNGTWTAVTLVSSTGGLFVSDTALSLGPVQIY